MEYIEFKNINKTFFKATPREFKALENINFTISKGDFVTIVGSNGAGKSTLLNLIQGLIDKDSGNIYINGKDILQISQIERAKFISCVFQNPLDGTAPRMTILENLSLAYRRGNRRTLRESTKKQEIEIFVKELKKLNLGLEDKLNTPIGFLSGGQRQCISLIMASLNNPKLILLDEHTSALDPKMQNVLMEITDEKIKEKNLTAFMVTHRLTDALKYGNRLLVMHRGKIVFDFKDEEKKKLNVKDLYEIILKLDCENN